MKEPWEIYADELWREVKRRGNRGADGQLEITMAALQEAGMAAGKATAYHLIDVLGWRKGEAMELLRRFNETRLQGDLSGLEALRAGYRDAYTTYMLEKRR